MFTFADLQEVYTFPFRKRAHFSSCFHFGLKFSLFYQLQEEKKPDQNERLRLHRNEEFPSTHTKGTKSDEISNIRGGEH